MKARHLTIILLLFSTSIFGQSLTGLWTGALSNDSTTVRKDQSFEIALTQYKDKVYGFSRSTFIVNDTLYYIIKRVKGTIEGDVCEVEDDNVVAHNFPKKPEKGVKVISTFRRDPVDSTWSMDGDWKTNKTKKYYSISGKMALKEEKNYEQSKIFPHLEELGIAKDVPFYQEAKNAPQSIAADRKDLNSISKTTPVIAKNNTSAPQVKGEGVAKGKTEFSEYAPPPKKEEPVVITENKNPVAEKKDVAIIVEEKKPVAVNNIQKPSNSIQKEEKKETKTEPKITPPIVQTPKPVEKTTPQKTESKPEIKKGEVVITTIPETKKDLPVMKPVEPVVISPLHKEIVTKVAERKMAAPQTFTFKSDSLMLSLYDNGEVDGDTVSVLINGQVVLAKQGLKASAIRKTIHVPAGTDDTLHLVLYAENLGRFPPNTGLLIVNDGDDVYQIRFSADLSQNASVIFHRKKE